LTASKPRDILNTTRRVINLVITQELFKMKLVRVTTLFIAGITFIVFDELVKSIDEASRSIDQQREMINKRLTGSNLKRQALAK
jgi:hypothetical protein